MPGWTWEEWLLATLAMVAPLLLVIAAAVATGQL